MIHRINVNAFGLIELGLHTPFRDDCDTWTRVERWLREDREWHVVSTLRGFWPPETEDVILLRIPGVGLNIGLGRQLRRLAPPRATFDHESHIAVRTTLQVRRLCRMETPSSC